jgi:beta propeller repeat protein
MGVARAGRVALITLLVAMLLGGSASGLGVVLPSINWTVAGVSVSDTYDEDSAVISGDLVAWEYDTHIRVRNLATGETRTIPGAGRQDDPDISGDRVVYMDDRGDGDYDIMMYRWSTNTTSEVRNTPAYEGWPVIDGNYVLWWDNTNHNLWGRSYDMGGFTALQLTDWGTVTFLYDVDNGRAVLCNPDDGMVWVRTLRPDSGWGGAVHVFTTDVETLSMHGDRVAFGVYDSGTTDHDIVYYDIRTDTVTDVTTNDAVDDEWPSIFHNTVAYHKSGANSQIGYDILGFSIALTPDFGGAEDDRFPSLYGHRIAYQRSASGDSDVMLATSNSKLQARTSGANRFATAAATSFTYFSDASNVVLCNGLNFPDALSAAPLAKALKAPLLLTAPGSLSPETLNEITRLGPQKVWIIGGSDVVSDSIYSQLDATYDVERIAGPDRYATSAAIARRFETIVGASTTFRAFFARGDAFPDALAVGPVACAAMGPVMLVRTDAIPAPIASAIDDLDITQSYVIGGEDVVKPAVFDAIRALEIANGGIGAIERWSGANRYATAVDVANKGLAYRWIDLDTLGFAIGTNFPDALGGGAALGSYGSALVLTSGTSLSADTAAFLDAHRYDIGRVDFFGGADVLQPAVYDAVLAKIY